MIPAINRSTKNPRTEDRMMTKLRWWVSSVPCEDVEEDIEEDEKTEVELALAVAAEIEREFDTNVLLEAVFGTAVGITEDGMLTICDVVED